MTGLGKRALRKRLRWIGDFLLLGICCWSFCLKEMNEGGPRINPHVECVLGKDNMQIRRIVSTSSKSWLCLIIFTAALDAQANGLSSLARTIEGWNE
jgi:hypothetical protein